MGGVMVPPCWLFGLRHPSNGAYMVVGLGSGHCVKMAAFKRAHTKEYSSVPSPPVSLTSQWATATHHIPRRHPPTPAGRSDSGSYEVTAFSLSPSVHRLYLSSKSRISVSLHPMDFLWSSLADHQYQMLWGLLLLMPNPHTGVLM